MGIWLPSTRVAQPQSAVGVNWSNPITRGALALLNPGAIQECVTGTPASLYSASLTSTPYGKASSASSNGGDGVFVGKPADVGIGPLTDFLLIYNYAVSGGGSIYRYGAGSYSTRLAGVGITVEHSYIANNWGAFDGGSDLTDTLASSGEQLPGGLQLLMHTRDGTTHRLYRNGVLKASVAGTSGVTSTAAFVQSNLVESGGIFSVAAPILISGRLNRCISAGEAWIFAQNIWQLFEDEQTYIPTSSGGANAYVLSPGGVLTLSGSNSLLRSKVFLPGGTVSFSGAAAIPKTRAFTPGGTILFSGTYPFLRARVQVPSGTVVFSGAAPISTSAYNTYNLIPTGSVQFSGTYPLVRTHVQPVSGLVQFSGNSGVIFIPAGGGAIPGVSRFNIGAARSMRMS